MALTPMMRQYLTIKETCEDCFLFFRLGDFYEMFMEDAKRASAILEIALTGRDAGLDEKIPMCGVPYHSAATYINRLVSKGYKVAICEQVEDPKLTKGIVKREVVRVITPGTVLDETVLNEKDNNYIAAICCDGDRYGLAVADITTGEFKVTSIPVTAGGGQIEDELMRIQPAECILEDEALKQALPSFKGYISMSKGEHKDALKKLTVDETIHGYKSIKKSAMILYHYLHDTQKGNIDYLKSIEYYTLNDYMFLDYQTRKNLEVTENIRKGTRENTLLSILDKTRTAMGGRLLKKWLEQPLINKEQILWRQSIISFFKNDLFLSEALSKALKDIYDIERILGKISYGNGNGRDFLALKHSLVKIEAIKDLLKEKAFTPLEDVIVALGNHNSLIDLLDESIDEQAPIAVKDGSLIKDSYHPDVAELRTITKESKSLILKLEADEKKKTGIKTMKIGYNRVFGYYIEVTKSNVHLVPDTYIRKQTIANGERYISEPLKELEYKIVHADEKVKQLEYELFLGIREQVLEETVSLKKAAHQIAIIDSLLSFAKIANQYDYVAPEIVADPCFEIVDGRHPVVERLVPFGDYIPNSFLMDPKEKNLAIITGPNMAGKSTFIRTLAIVTIMAQCGSYVPAKAFKLSVVDRVFARVGASDDLASGQSTFMVEMNEVATIINNATDKSLIILDEVGRGTSTLDGLAIAWAVSDYLLTAIKARTVFATHYHELINLETEYTNVLNLSMAVQEYKDDVVFLRKVVAGGASKSYGIHVAKMAGLPEHLIKRAEEKIVELENHMPPVMAVNDGQQLALEFVEKENPLKEKLDAVDLNAMTPMDALQFLFELKKSQR